MIIKRDCIYPPTGKNRPLHIYLPDEYDTSDQRYPVMYFFDGHNLFSNEDATYGKCWGLKEFLDGWDQKIILVGIECGHEGDERLSEYLPYRPGFGPLFNFRPMGELTMNWIVNDIKPMIDKEFRTLPQREHTAIGGSSMGGLMALYAITEYNDWFFGGACVSTATGLCYRSVVNSVKKALLQKETRVYLSWGTREAFLLRDRTKPDSSSITWRQNRMVAKLLKRNGAQVKLVCQVGGRHCEADWEKQNNRFMDFIWK